jgi:hypothetical protein
MPRSFVTRDRVGNRNIFLWFVPPYEADGEWFTDAGKEAPLGQDPRVKLDLWQCKQFIGRVVRPGEKVQIRTWIVIVNRVNRWLANRICRTSVPRKREAA